MLKAITYTEEEEKLIEGFLKSPGFDSSAWEDGQLKDLKKKIKDFYVKEQKNVCVYCRVKMPSNNGRVWDVEHVISRIENGGFMFEPRNLCVSCPDCNVSKGVKKVTNSKAKKSYPRNFIIAHPHFDKYEDHVKVISAGSYYFARTAKGEQTIAVCRLNRFYEVAEYEADGIDLDEIQSLAAQLEAATTQKQRQELCRKLAVASISNIDK
ncbi:HNH endonuclease [Halopseudomonas sabulinigri]|uniref:HNH endonuclease n=1 Tax=Halopseudomonas sabulinigri TaxID=472181 RepID=A0ABP9ZQH0_9GAMM